jgi:wyosine [tRNA(Phe)-imidazoG37] synthetase (radical SAM superfamily)
MARTPSIVFGPVPSRRLGRSLGINHVWPKTCSYACAYCQVGPTVSLRIDRRSFCDPTVIAEEVGDRLDLAARRREAIDYVTFVPDGEPTLDAGLGRAIELIKRLAVRVAVITNASLLWRPEVRNALAQADWVSMKIDAADEGAWLRMNRPHGGLSLETVLQGQRDFAATFRGELVTETMLVAGVNDGRRALERLADCLGRLGVSAAWLGVPVRPPAESWVRAPAAETVWRACERLARAVPRVACLTTHEGDDFSATGDLEADLVAIGSVHPLREAAVRDIVRRAGADWRMVERLVEQHRLDVVDYDGVRFYRPSTSLEREERTARPRASHPAPPR